MSAKARPLKGLIIVCFLSSESEILSMQIFARRYDDQQAVVVDIENDKISRLAAHATEKNTALPWIAPGFVDLQVNGYGGDDFTDPRLTTEQVAAIGRRLDPCGVTAYCPTATTNSFDILAHAMQTLATAYRELPEVRCRMVGIHLEGPYIAAADGPRGAHPLEHVRAPDWEEFQRLQAAADGLIRILTLSPEWEDSARFIAQVVGSGVVVSIGHTQADSEQIKAAVDAGATMSTHLGNGAHQQIRRHPNYIWDQLADDRLTAGIIADAQHLPPAVLKSFLRGKTPQRAFLVSDVTGLAGMKPGLYHTGIGDVEMLDDGKLVVAGQRDLLAGASLPITYGIANLMRHAELDLKTAVELASSRPAEAIGLAGGKLEVGATADLVLFDLPVGAGNEPIQVRATINTGRVVFGEV